METKNINVCETFPDGTPIDGWFYDTNVPSLEVSLMMESFTQKKFRH